MKTPATALYVKADDLLKGSPQLAPWPPEAGIAPSLSDAELLTLAVMQALLGYTSDARWLRHALRICGTCSRTCPAKQLQQAAAPPGSRDDDPDQVSGP